MVYLTLPPTFQENSDRGFQYFDQIFLLLLLFTLIIGKLGFCNKNRIAPTRHRLPTSKVSRTGIEPVTDGLMLVLYSPPLCQLSYHEYTTSTICLYTDYCLFTGRKLIIVIRGRHFPPSAKRILLSYYSYIIGVSFPAINFKAKSSR